MTRSGGAPLAAVAKIPEFRIAVAGLALRSILSERLYLAESIRADGAMPSGGVAELCREQWTDFADALTALPDGVELAVVVGPRQAGTSLSDRPALTVLVLERSDADPLSVRRTLDDVATLVRSTIGFADFEQILDDSELRAAVATLSLPVALRFERRYENVVAGDLFDEGAVHGFNPGLQEQPDRVAPALEEPRLRHLFEWTPAGDPWRRLIEVLAAAESDAALVVRVRAWPVLPPDCRRQAYDDLAAVERWSRGLSDGPQAIPLSARVEHVRNSASRRADIAEGRALTARVFLVGADRLSAAVIATVRTSIDDAFAILPSHSSAHLQGGAVATLALSSELTAPMENPDLAEVFSPREITAVLRTPLPARADYPGLPLRRSRTALCAGPEGDDVPLGANRHHGVSRRVCLEQSARTRHTYVVGQTGTGKSTLLLNMILHDVACGRGVGVIDPHGSLIEGVLSRMPAGREDEVVLVDATDQEWSVGMNPLLIEEADPRAYLHERDLCIEDLLSFVNRSYDPAMAGPMFESHVRGMLALLIGTKAPEPPLSPSLLILRSLYGRRSLRAALAERVGDLDPTIQAFVRETEAASFDSSIKNMSQYVTSKFNRFFADSLLRNMLCQNRSIDVESVVNDGRILLVHLGRGRFGEQAAALLATQVVSGVRRAVFQRRAGSAAPLFALYVDEFQLVADERFVELLAEARKFNLALTLAHQFVAQLPEPVRMGIFGNVGTSIVFRTGPADAKLLEPIVSPEFSSADIVTLPNFRAYVRTSGASGRSAFSVEASGPPLAGSPERADAVRARSRSRHARLATEVEDEIRLTLKAYEALGDAD